MPYRLAFLQVLAVLAPGPGTVGSLARGDYSDVVGGELLMEVSE